MLIIIFKYIYQLIIIVIIISSTPAYVLLTFLFLLYINFCIIGSIKRTVVLQISLLICPSNSTPLLSPFLSPFLHSIKHPNSIPHFLLLPLFLFFIKDIILHLNPSFLPPFKGVWGKI